MQRKGKSSCAKSVRNTCAADFGATVSACGLCPLLHEGSALLLHQDGEGGSVGGSCVGVCLYCSAGGQGGLPHLSVEGRDAPP